MDEKYQRSCRLEIIKGDWKNCTRCMLNCYRNNMVWWRGDIGANLVMIGEAPGAREDETGVPFVGKAGKFLDEIFFEATGEIIEDSALLINVVACRPPSNRTPKMEEMKACNQRLFSIMKIIKPKVAVLLGSTAARRIAGVQPITRWRGDFIDAVLVGDKKRVVKFETMPTFHPSYLLRTGLKSKEYADCVSDIRKAWEAVYG
jgi:uracil-DNA glycosylase